MRRYRRPIFIAFCAIAGAIGACASQPYIDPNSDAVLIVITVFTVFAGFLVAIIAVLGDPVLLPEGSWRAAEIRRDTVERRLIWHSWLFTAYLATIGLLFAGVVLSKAQLPASHLWIKDWVERAYLFFGITSFLLSFALPWTLMVIQRRRVDAEIEQRRQDEGIQSGDGKT
jgi:MFS family permease